MHERHRWAAEVETAQISAKLEQSFKERVSKLDQTLELVQVKDALKSLRKAAAERESVLQRQLKYFKGRALQAENAANAAERGAKKAAEMGKLAQDRYRTAIERERAAELVAQTDCQKLQLQLDTGLNRERQQRPKIQNSNNAHLQHAQHIGQKYSPNSHDPQQQMQQQAQQHPQHSSNSGGGGVGLGNLVMVMLYVFMTHDDIHHTLPIGMAICADYRRANFLLFCIVW